MKLLIFYSSNSGSTYTVAKIIESVLSENPSIKQVELKNAKDCKVEDLKQVDCFIAGSPSWYVNEKEGQPHEDMLALLNQLNGLDLSSKYFAIFGCGDKSYLNFCNAVDIMNQEFSKTGAKKFVESLKIDSFFFDQVNNEATAHAWTQELGNKLPTNSLF